jgi:hypothetical protein
MPAFRRNTLSPLAALVASVLKMEAVCFSGTLTSTEESTRRQNPEEHHHHHPFRRENLKSRADRNLVFHCCEDLKSQITVCLSQYTNYMCQLRGSVLLWLLYVLRKMCMKRTHIGLVMSVRMIQSRTAGLIWMKFGMDVMSLGTTLKPYFSISYNLQHQHGGRTNLWCGIDTSATGNRAIKLCIVIDFRKIQNFEKRNSLYNVKQHGGCMK